MEYKKESWEEMFMHKFGISNINKFEYVNLLDEDDVMKIVKKVQEEEKEKWKQKISELRNDLYDGLPVGEIKDAFEMIKLTNKHMKELDKLVEGEKKE